jgi:hypothetical protein
MKYAMIYNIFMMAYYLAPSSTLLLREDLSPLLSCDGCRLQEDNIQLLVTQPRRGLPTHRILESSDQEGFNSQAVQKPSAWPSEIVVEI